MEFETPYHPCFIPNEFSQEGHNVKWTTEEKNSLEYALALFDEDTPDRWVNVASAIPTKSVFDVIRHYNSFKLEMVGEGSRKKSSTVIKSTSGNERKKRVLHWTEEEHKRFLEGLLKCGKGRWRDIAQKFVFTKTPTQVASHAQKYYIRQNRNIHDIKRRASINDITTLIISETITPSPDDQDKSLPFQESQIMFSPHDQKQTSIQEVQDDDIEELLNITEESQIMPSPHDQKQTSIQEVQDDDIEEFLNITEVAAAQNGFQIDSFWD
ncbi:transcription factor DIVARICATA-like [Lotus japonicus]|uniref:transcription factor DIVARICATA-like n=1 Tax=Lotus japonicus TaxID=34305 RepID=UPI0025859C89|nr:transcription factor DIVARICATA-like [Lotus japonicus]